ncbi:MAG: hypothetical protein EOP51_19490 [Sphingobacteriales bacterium]|nr:MAG: hypothetical protein EOP51_19490 [Sphingobacteriales bacterium]
MKKQLLLPLILSSASLFSKAQNVGIGTATPDASAQLHIESNNKGMLIPKVSLSSLTTAAPVTAPAFGLVVFNTNGALPGGYGIFYWNGLSWSKLQTQEGTWNVGGNSFAAMDYPLLGTLNNKPLRFIVNNVPAAFIDSGNTHIGFRAGNQHSTAKNTVAIGNAALFINSVRSGLVAVGDSALFSNGAGATEEHHGRGNTAVGFKSLQRNGLGGDNTAIGDGSLTANISGNMNIAMGAIALNLNQFGEANVALGTYSLRTNVEGDNNVAVGKSALYFNKASQNIAIGTSALLNNSNDPTFNVAVNNIAIGYNSMYDNRTGHSNIAMGESALSGNRRGNGNVSVGYRSGYNSTGDGNIYLGFRVGENALSSNKLYIDNSNADSNNALIYGDFAADSLKLNAKVIVRNRLQVNDDVHSNGNVVAYAAGAAPATLPPPVSGAGRRMMWYMDKAAFRAGYVANDEWNQNNVGRHSAAFGYNSAASGNASFAAGEFSLAQGYASIALGGTPSALGMYSVALGDGATAVGNASFASGRWTIAEGINSTAIGNESIAYGENAVAIGQRATAEGNNAIALGTFSTGLGDYTTAFGYNSTARAYNSISMGTYNDTTAGSSRNSWVATDPLLTIGNGTANNARRNAFAVFKNGNTDVNGYLRIGRAAGANADNSGIETGWGVSGKQGDAGKIQYGGFGTTHTLNLVGGGTNATGADRQVKVWSEGGFRIRGNALPDADNLYSLGQSGSRWTTIWAASGTITTSDARLKTNIASLGYGLKELMLMKPVQYNWKHNPQGEKEIGFLAQDIQKIIPEAVVEPTNGDAMGMKYTELIPVLVNAIQEQQKQIEELKKLLMEKGK